MTFLTLCLQWTRPARSAFPRLLGALLALVALATLAAPVVADPPALWGVTADASGVVTYTPAGPDAASPGEERLPLVVIHGLNNTIHSPGIAALAESLARAPRIAGYYRVFTLEYDTAAALDGSGEGFAAELRRVTGRHRFVLIGHSMGGLVARAALELYGRDGSGYDLLARCARLITLGTPHHGTPVANSAWMDITLGGVPLLASLRAQAEASTGLSGALPGVRDLAWDDFDGNTPAAAKGNASAVLARLNAAFPALAAFTECRYVIYGGVSTAWPLPFALLELGGNPDLALQYRALGLVLAQLAVPGSDTYAAGDGIVPLTSALYLVAAPPNSPHEPVGRVTNTATAGDDGRFLVEVNPAAILARAPAVRSVTVFPDTLHFEYPVAPAVTAALWQELRLTDEATGDMNGDGAVSITDALIALRCVVGLQAPTFAQRWAADSDRDGALRIPEVIRILRRIVGLPE